MTTAYTSLTTFETNLVNSPPSLSFSAKYSQYKSGQSNLTIDILYSRVTADASDIDYFLARKRRALTLKWVSHKSSKKRG